jgi:hypothetical protein
MNIAEENISDDDGRKPYEIVIWDKKLEGPRSKIKKFTINELKVLKEEMIEKNISFEIRECMKDGWHKNIFDNFLENDFYLKNDKTIK